MAGKIDYPIRGLVGLVDIPSFPESDELQRFYARVGQFHIPVWEDIVGGRVVFLPGSDARAEKISRLFSKREVHSAERGIIAYTGTIDKVPVLAMSSGIGSGQVEIIALELMRAMVEKGGAIIRYGSQGALKPLPLVQTGDILLATYAIPADSSFAYMTHQQLQQGDIPTMSQELHNGLVSALQECGYMQGDNTARTNTTPRFHIGGIHSKGLLYAQEIGVGPRAAHFEQVRSYLETIPNLFGSEMETALLYTMAAWVNYLTEKFEYGRKPILAGSLNFFIGDSDNPFHPDAVVRGIAETNLIDTVPYVARNAYAAVQRIEQKS